MTIFKVGYRMLDMHDHIDITYGYFSSREKAEELFNEFVKYDELYSESEEYYIEEIVIDEISEDTNKTLSQYKKNWDYEQSCMEKEF